MTLARWYREHGRHDLPWRHTRDRWKVLTSEVMLQQTQVSRVLEVWPGFVERYPTPHAMAAVPLGEVIRDWGSLGYPRRARRLWEAAGQVARQGWPTELVELPGVGRYTAAAVAALADDVDTSPVDANIRRVVERISGCRLTAGEAEETARVVGDPLRSRDRTLALMDVGAVLCRPRQPRCAACPLSPGCRTRGPLAGETRNSQAPFAGSFRQRRGRLLARLRCGAVEVSTADTEVLRSLVSDGLAVIDGAEARLP